MPEQATLNRILREGGAQMFPQWLYAEPEPEAQPEAEAKPEPESPEIMAVRLDVTAPEFVTVIGKRTHAQQFGAGNNFVCGTVEIAIDTGRTHDDAACLVDVDVLERGRDAEPGDGDVPALPAGHLVAAHPA